MGAQRLGPTPRRTIAEDNLLLGTSRNAWGREETKFKDRVREKLPTLSYQALYLTSPCSGPYPITFPTIPNHTGVWVDRRGLHPEKRVSLTRELEGRKETDIKGRTPQKVGRLSLSKKKKERGKDTRIL